MDTPKWHRLKPWKEKPGIIQCSLAIIFTCATPRKPPPTSYIWRSQREFRRIREGDRGLPYFRKRKNELVPLRDTVTVFVPLLSTDEAPTTVHLPVARSVLPSRLKPG